nr:phage portal protein [uncultured Anaerotignum sp.]
MFITEMELLKARLAAGRRLNDSHILKEILREDKNSERKKRMEEGERYYCGKHDSLRKDFRRSPISETGDNGEEQVQMFFNPNRSNHHCVHPFHHTLVAQKTAYLVGREPTLSVRNGDKAFAQLLTEMADEDFNSVLQNWLIGASNKGVEYLHVYYDAEGAFRYCIVPAEEIIAIYDEEYQQELREVIRYYEITVLDGGKETIRRRVEWWTAEEVSYFTENGDGEFLRERKCGHWAVAELLDGEETEVRQHGWGRVPFIPLRNNEKELTDLELIKGLIDAYDYVSSEGTNNLLDLVDLYWVIQGYGGETAGAVAKKLQINKAVQISDSSGSVEAKQVQLPVEARLDWMRMLRRDIFHFGMGVDTDSDDWGKAVSGVALKFQYAMFYLKINGIMPEIKRAVKEFFRFAVEDSNRENGTDWDWRKIQITLNTNGITDDMETMQLIRESKGLVSEKTLLGKHPFVEDVNSEMEQLERERREKKDEIDRVD